MLYPTATDKALGFGKWGAGPTALTLQQNRGWTYGLLANHLWSYADAGRYSASSAEGASDGSGAQVNATFIQPFVSFTTKTFTTFGLNTESTYDWSHSQWTVRLNISVSQLLKVGKQPLQLSLGVKYYGRRPKGWARLGPALCRQLSLPEMSKATLLTTDNRPSAPQI
jgi:hypothetical protein